MQFGTATSIWRPSWERDACASKDTSDQYSFTALVPICDQPLSVVSTHQLESRMRENRLSGLMRGGQYTVLIRPLPAHSTESALGTDVAALKLRFRSARLPADAESLHRPEP